MLIVLQAPYCAQNSASILCVSNDESSVLPDCFIQTIRLYSHSRYYPKLEYHVSIFFINNTAELGSAVYGGLLDRCTASTFAETNDDKLIGLQYIEKIAEISKGSTITSDPVRVIFCSEHNPHTIFIKKGGAIKINVAAIDQVGNSVNATIHSSVVTESGIGRLKEGRAKQRVGNQCTELEYNVFSQDNSAQVELYADGPCTNLGMSRQTINISFLPCTCPT